jgi:hypothetical protein
MLTAKQAREISEQSGTTHDKILASINEEVIRIADETGKTSFDFAPGSRAYGANEFFIVEKIPYRTPEFTNKQFPVVKKLRDLGYKVHITEIDIYEFDSEGDRADAKKDVVRIEW